MNEALRSIIDQTSTGAGLGTHKLTVLCGAVLMAITSCDQKSYTPEKSQNENQQAGGLSIPDKNSQITEPEREYTDEEKLKFTIEFYIEQRKREGSIDPVEEVIQRLKREAQEDNPKD